jgi:hypothetical protein
MTCYVRHELAPGIHMDIPHEHEEGPAPAPVIVATPGPDLDSVILAHLKKWGGQLEPYAAPWRYP